MAGSQFQRQIDRKRWKRLRLMILDRDNWRCRECGRYGNEVDHIQPLQRGGDLYAESNLECLCKSCHLVKTATENGRLPALTEWVSEIARISKGLQ